jgi:hypothetical protein
MISSTLHDAYSAFKALRSINDSTKLPAKTAWRVSRLLSKLTSALKAYDAAQVKLILDHGGVRTAIGAQLNQFSPDPADSEVMVARKRSEDADNRAKLQAELWKLGEEMINIEYDPLPLEFFGDLPMSANDLADLGPYISE